MDPGSSAPGHLYPRSPADRYACTHTHLRRRWTPRRHPSPAAGVQPPTCPCASSQAPAGAWEEAGTWLARGFAPDSSHGRPVGRGGSRPAAQPALLCGPASPGWSSSSGQSLWGLGTCTSSSPSHYGSYAPSLACSGWPSFPVLSEGGRPGGLNTLHFTG